MRERIYIPLILSILFFTGCLLKKTKNNHRPLNFLLITIDTIRPDHIGCYGYKKIKTPNIDQLAKEGILFENAFSSIPLTLPSHTSILTGTYPNFHGIRNNGTYAVSNTSVTLAELLKERGYTTAAFISTYVMGRRFGLDQGFDIYNDELPLDTIKNISSHERRADAVTQAAIKWLENNVMDKFFLWVHYFDPHMNYDPPTPFSVEYADNLYDGEIAYTDKWLGVLLESLNKLKLDENTMIILTGDHGEGLGEHKEKTHGLFIYDSTLRVPLIFTCPKLFSKPKRINSLVRLIDIAPTILKVNGYEPYKDMQGVSLLTLMQGKVNKFDLVLYCESYYPQFSHNWSPLFGLRTEKWKYIDAPNKELYKIDKDPFENKNIFNQKRQKAKSLAKKLSKLKINMASSLGNQDSQRLYLDEEAKEKLESLGYVFTKRENNKQLKQPDPKDMIDVLEYFDQGLEYFGEKKYQNAKDKFEKVLEKHQQDVGAYTILGHTYEAMGEYEKAIEAFNESLNLGCNDLRIYVQLGIIYIKLHRFQEAIDTLNNALEINPRCKEAYENLGRCYLQKKELDQAIVQFEKILEIDQNDVNAHNQLAIIYMQKRQYDLAFLACETALNTDSNNASVLLTLGSTLLYKNRNQDALETIQKSLIINPDSYNAHYFAGLITFQMSRLNDAIFHFNEAIRLNPDWAEPHFNLGFIYYQENNFSMALNEFEISLKINPNLTESRNMIENIKRNIIAK